MTSCQELLVQSLTDACKCYCLDTWNHFQSHLATLACELAQACCEKNECSCPNYLPQILLKKTKKESLKLWNSQLCISNPQKVYFSFFFTWVVWFLNNFSLAPGFWTVDCSCSGINFRLHRFIEIALNFKEPLSLSGRPVFVEVNKWLPYGELDLL